jgi:hypothetical protein
MNDQTEPFDSLDSARAEMRLRLSHEFRALHRRRHQQRIAAICLAPFALVSALIAWSWISQPQNQFPGPPIEPFAVTPTPSPTTEKTVIEVTPKLVENDHNVGYPEVSNFQAIEFIEIKPDDLPTWLAEAKSDLIVYKVNGRTEVVTERELLEASTKKRKQRMN